MVSPYPETKTRDHSHPRKSCGSIFINKSLVCLFLIISVTTAFVKLSISSLDYCNSLDFLQLFLPPSHLFTVQQTEWSFQHKSHHSSAQNSPCFPLHVKSKLFTMALRPSVDQALFYLALFISCHFSLPIQPCWPPPVVSGHQMPFQLGALYSLFCLPRTYPWAFYMTGFLASFSFC